MSVGTDHIDNRECKKRGVFVVNTPDIASDSAADLTVALVLMTTRRLVEGKKKTYHWTGPQALVARNYSPPPFFKLSVYIIKSIYGRHM